MNEAALGIALLWLAHPGWSDVEEHRCESICLTRRDSTSITLAMGPMDRPLRRAVRRIGIDCLRHYLWHINEVQSLTPAAPCLVCVLCKLPK
jgi:hypothetical protein